MFFGERFFAVFAEIRECCNGLVVLDLGLRDGHLFL